MRIKYWITAMLLLSNCAPASGQDSIADTFFQTAGKAHLYYVDLKNAVAYVYQIGHYLDKAGTGYSIRSTDTLTRQPNGYYLGKTTRLIYENNKRYLATEQKRPKKLLIEEVRDLRVAHTNLNNAYYLDSYFRLSEELNKRYPLNHHTFRNGFYTWNALPGKEMDHLQFRAFAAQRLKELADSISSLQERHVALTNYIIQNLSALDYPALKDSLVKLPSEYGYYSTAINEVARQRPEYFFRLAEDFPDNRSLIFRAVEDNKAIIQGLRTVAGHDDIKKEFFKDRRFGKTMPYKIIGTYAIIIGLITLLIVSQK